MKSIKLKSILIFAIFLTGCNKGSFLDTKPSSSITEPTTVADFQQLLENDASVMNYTGGLAQIGSDDYVLSDADYLTATTTERNAYIWAKDIYGSDINIPDWNKLYNQVFTANVVLDGLAKKNLLSGSEGQFVKGWALFCRAYAFYDLTRTFCNPYDKSSAASDLGIPLRLTSGVDKLEKRASIQQTFDQIFSDLNQSLQLLPATRNATYPYRPSGLAVYALLARIYLDMRDYSNAELFADKCLANYSTLIDYNTASNASTTPFSKTNDELIYHTTQVIAYSSTTINTAGTKAKIAPDLLSLYNAGDLRKVLYFRLLADGSTYGKKIGYNGIGNYHFTGLATDEVYLIKAECLARRDQIQASMDKLNQLLVKRYSNTSAYVPVTATSATDALNKIIIERRKELVWRGLRWQDIKRLNKEGANITLSRTVSGTTYSISPNDSRFTYPIPNDEIAISGIAQNNR